jgi:hypothetical protein
LTLRLSRARTTRKAVGTGPSRRPRNRRQLRDQGELLETILLTACAGAVGSTLSGVFKVRDQLVRLDELRGFWPAMRVQPIVGACAGLIVFLILDSKAIEPGAGGSVTWSGRGVLAFAAGWSKPFFLGIVQRVAVVSDRQPEDPQAKSERIPNRKSRA